MRSSHFYISLLLGCVGPSGNVPPPAPSEGVLSPVVEVAPVEVPPISPEIFSTLGTVTPAETISTVSTAHTAPVVVHVPVATFATPVVESAPVEEDVVAVKSRPAPVPEMMPAPEIVSCPDPDGLPPEPPSDPQEDSVSPEDVQKHEGHTLNQEVQEKTDALNKVDAATLSILNALRAKRGLPPLTQEDIEKDANPPMPSKSKD